MTKDAARLVLVVEDDVSVRRPLVKFLEMHGFVVVTAETAEEGTDALVEIRDTYASTLEEDAAEEYVLRFDHEVGRRLPRFALGL